MEPVVIVGGGPVGLALSLVLARGLTPFSVPTPMRVWLPILAPS